jgi:hypothetical protein
MKKNSATPNLCNYFINLFEKSLQLFTQTATHCSMEIAQPFEGLGHRDLIDIAIWGLEAPSSNSSPFIRAGVCRDK